VVSNFTMPGGGSYGWVHQTDPGNDTNSIVQNNLIIVQRSGDTFVTASAGVAAGVTDDYNLFSGPGGWAGGTFANWKSAHAGWDAHSVNADALMTDVTEFNQTVAQKFVYDWSKAAPRTGSPAIGAGLSQSTRFTTDFAGVTRRAGAFDVGAIAGP
jgi:hypothetical protein